MTVRRSQVLTRTITDDHGTQVTIRRCSTCTSWLPADTEHFYRCHPDRNDGALLTGICRPCKRAYVAEHKALALKHPETRNDFLARRRAARKRWIINHPDRQRELRNAARRRRYNARALDERASDARLRERERALREGREMTRRASTAIGAWRPSIGAVAHHERLPIEPLAAWVDAVRARDDRERTVLARDLRIPERRLYGIETRDHPVVSLEVADRLLTNYDRPVVIRSRDLERRLIAWAQGLPGNGARLLRYMDRAETVAHLADRCVLKVEDLWEELGEA